MHSFKFQLVKVEHTNNTRNYNIEQFELLVLSVTLFELMHKYAFVYVCSHPGPGRHVIQFHEKMERTDRATISAGKSSSQVPKLCCQGQVGTQTLKSINVIPKVLFWYQ